METKQTCTTPNTNDMYVKMLRARAQLLGLNAELSEEVLREKVISAFSRLWKMSRKEIKELYDSFFALDEKASESEKEESAHRVLYLKAEVDAPKDTDPMQLLSDAARWAESRLSHSGIKSSVTAFGRAEYILIDEAKDAFSRDEADRRANGLRKLAALLLKQATAIDGKKPWLISMGGSDLDEPDAFLVWSTEKPDEETARAAVDADPDSVKSGGIELAIKRFELSDLVTKP